MLTEAFALAAGAGCAPLARFRNRGFFGAQGEAANMAMATTKQYTPFCLSTLGFGLLPSFMRRGGFVFASDSAYDSHPLPAVKSGSEHKLLKMHDFVVNFSELDKSQ
jgi:hypothetical protein